MREGDEEHAGWPSASIPTRPDILPGVSESGADKGDLPSRDPLARRSTDDALARQALAEALGDHEELVWAGRPRPGVRFSKADLLLIPFSLLWGGFALVWEGAVLFFLHGPWFFCLWGVPFVAMGQYMIWGRFLVDARRRARTFYGLTQDRAVIVEDGRSLKISSVGLIGTELAVDERSDGGGTIQFGRATLRALAAGWPTIPGTPRTPTFEHIDEVYDVYKTILALQGSGRGQR
jgi:hypothetical protein